MRQIVDPKTFRRTTIALARFGCANRPFYQISVFPDVSFGRKFEGNVIEQVGSFDPLPNNRNEKLVALNIHRLKYWIGVKNAHVSTPVLELLGLAGLLPIHPKTYICAKDNCRVLLEKQKHKINELDDNLGRLDDDDKNVT